jgi:hypothetical protein
MIGKGVFEVEVSGRKVGFRFGPLSGLYTEEVSGFSIQKYWDKFRDGLGGSCLLFYFYGGRKFFIHTEIEKAKKAGSPTAQLEKELKELSLVEVSDLIENMSEADLWRVHNESLGIPNLKAPSLQGPIQTSETSQ